MRIEESTVDVETPTGPMRTYLYRPQGGGRWPGVSLYSEIFQRTGPIHRLAARLSGHGYVVALPEIYHEYEPPGTVLAYDTAGTERGNELKYTKPVTTFDTDAAAVLEHLRHTGCDALGTIGFCIGGHLAFRAALQKDVRAAACFYATDIHSGTLGAGKHDDSLQRAAEIEGELLMVWGRQDPHIPVEGRRTIYDRLIETGRNFTWHEFNAAHAFMRDEGPRHDAGLAHVCFELVLEVFSRRLRP